MEDDLTGRDRSRLQRARAKGYLAVPGRPAELLARSFSKWCWTLRIPLVWYERRSPRSRYGRVHLDLFTTPYVLTGVGEAEIRSLAARFATKARLLLSPHDACWDGVPIGRLEEAARTLFRCATRTGNCRTAPAVRPVTSCRKILPWRASA